MKSSNLLTGLLVSIYKRIKRFLIRLRQALMYMDVSEKCKLSLEARTNLRIKSLLQSYANTREEAECIACSENAGILINSMMTFYSKNFHSDLQKYIGKHEDQDWYRHLIAKQIIEMVVRSRSNLADSKVIGHIKIRVSTPFSLLEHVPDYKDKSINDILCTCDGPELSFRSVIDSSSEPERLHDASINWFLSIMKNYLPPNKRLLQKGYGFYDTNVVFQILSKSVNIPTRPRHPT